MPPPAPQPLRADLSVRKLTQQGETVYVVKEPKEGVYLRFDEAQYVMLTLLDGQRDLDTLVALFNERSEEYEFDRNGLIELLDQVKGFKLLLPDPQAKRAVLLDKLREGREEHRSRVKGSLLYLRYHLVDPDALFDRIVDRVSFLWQPWWLKAGHLLMAVALLLVFFHADRFAADFAKVYFLTHQDLSGYLLIWLVVLAAIALHEVGHGLTCKHFGGHVTDMGLLFMVFQPCLYCNVNDAWLFEHRRDKVYVALAGVWSELFLSALAVFVWLLVEVESGVGQVAFILMTVSMASSLFINLNPLMKYDGYYILSDVLEIPNLRQNALAWFSHRLKQGLGVEDVAPFAVGEREQRLYLLYGGLTVLYLTLMLLGIAFLGYGLIAPALGTWGILFFLYLTARITGRLTGGWGKVMTDWGARNLLATPVRRWGSGLVFAFLLLLGLVEQPVVIVTEGRVEAVRHLAHMPESGFIDRVGYDDQRRPLPGEPLFTVRATELALERERLAVRGEHHEQVRKQASVRGEGSLLARAEIELAATREALEAVEERLRRTTVVFPPGAWRVDGLPAELLTGRFFLQGREVVALVPERERTMTVILEQPDYVLVRGGDGVRVRLVGNGVPVLAGTVQGVTPVTRATGAMRLFQVRIVLALPEGGVVPPVGLTGEARITGAALPLWQHVLRPVRNVLRAELWI